MTDTPSSQKFLLTVLGIIIAIIVLSGWIFLMKTSPVESPADEIESTPTPTPIAEQSGEFVFDNSLATAITIVSALNDDNVKNDAVTDSLSRNNFLKKLASQIGSTGEIIGGELSSFHYYTEWYIGGYADGSDWNEHTPWCASYVSWCLDQISLSLNSTPPRYANVDNFMGHFGFDAWLPHDAEPTPGDLVFFGTYGDPNHMGVVLAVEDQYIYTIEGNIYDVVGIRKYLMNDIIILGYGVLDWKN